MGPGSSDWIPADGETASRGVTVSMKRAATGTLLGLAIGDAMGFPTEFSDITQIAAKCGPWRTFWTLLPAWRCCSVTRAQPNRKAS
jgi:hypothetical protein